MGPIAKAVTAFINEPRITLFWYGCIADPYLMDAHHKNYTYNKYEHKDYDNVTRRVAKRLGITAYGYFTDPLINYVERVYSGYR